MLKEKVAVCIFAFEKNWLTFNVNYYLRSQQVVKILYKDFDSSRQGEFNNLILKAKMWKYISVTK